MDFDEKTLARMIEGAGGDERARPEHQERLREQVLEAFDCAGAGASRSASLFPQIQMNWRQIMRHAIFRVTAAAVLILAIGGVASWLYEGTTNLAFADFVNQIVDAKTAKFKAVYEVEGQPRVISETLVSAPDRMRQTMTVEGKPGRVMIWDSEKGRGLTLDQDRKQAMLVNFVNMPKAKSPDNIFLQLRTLLLDARDKPGFKREPLGEKRIDGRRVVGLRLGIAGQEWDLWGDPKTGFPIRIEIINNPMMAKKTKAVLTDFAFNMNLDESLFSVEPPRGYTTQSMRMDASSPAENDLLELFRQSSEFSGALPEALDMPAAVKVMEKVVARFGLKKGQEPNQQQMQKVTDLYTKYFRGIQFELQLAPESDAHYAGKGVLLGAPNTPIFWYRPKESKKYRVIYADLSVREADTPPSVPNAQAVPGKE